MSDPPAPPSAPKPHPTRSPSNPGTMKAVSAARSQPLPAASRTLSSDRLKAVSTDTALNVLSILKETWEDFRSADRFFKYKAGILAGWLLLSVATFFIARPTQGGTNHIDAQLVLGPDSDHPYFMIKNDSQKTWENVQVLVNQRFHATVDRIAPNGNVILNPRQLLGPDHLPAPPNLRPFEIRIETSEGSTTLLEGGQLP